MCVVAGTEWIYLTNQLIGSVIEGMRDERLIGKLDLSNGRKTYCGRERIYATQVIVVMATNSQSNVRVNPSREKKLNNLRFLPPCAIYQREALMTMIAFFFMDQLKRNTYYMYNDKYWSVRGYHGGISRRRGMGFLRPLWLFSPTTIEVLARMAAHITRLFSRGSLENEFPMDSKVSLADSLRQRSSSSGRIE